MSRWTRIWKSSDRPIYVYRRDDGTYKTQAYSMIRYHVGETALQNAIQFVKDLGDSSIVIKEEYV